uniref:Uncharacterized protein n=1 Tax=Oryza glaberrima TaxID=4538 RepID=I1NMC8_ORYGL
MVTSRFGLSLKPVSVARVKMGLPPHVVRSRDGCGSLFVCPGQYHPAKKHTTDDSNLGDEKDTFTTKKHTTDKSKLGDGKDTITKILDIGEGNNDGGGGGGSCGLRQTVTGVMGTGIYHSKI